MTLATPTCPSAAQLRSTALVKALTDRMLASPAEAYEAVTGAREWPPINGEHISDLAMDAANQADELIDLRNEGVFVPSFKIEKLLAAEAALTLLDKDAGEERRLVRWIAEDQVLPRRAF